MKKKILVCGGAGFIGHHLARRLKKKGHYVVVADWKPANEYCKDEEYCNEYYPLDLTRNSSWDLLSKDHGKFDEVYQLACNMGGAGFIFTGDNDFEIMSESCQINIHCVKWALKWKAKVFYSSSACIYPAYNQTDPLNPKCSEDSAYPAAPDSEYGWEKLFSERLYLTAHRTKGLDVRIARFHNIYGPEGTYVGGREKAPAAICRKVLESNGTIEIWGDGNQTRSFLYIDDCLDAVQALMRSDFIGPVNIGSEEMVSINELVTIAESFEGKSLNRSYKLDAPQGVRGRNSDNDLIIEKLGWEPKWSLFEGLEDTYYWIKHTIQNALATTP